MLRDNQRRAATARLVFFMLMLDTAALVLMSLLAQGLPDWNDVARGGGSSFTTAVYYGYLLLGVGYFILLIAGYVVLIRWLRRAYYNLHQLPGIHPDYSDGWAAGAWFVPFLNFVRPFTIMREVWQDTQRAAWGRVVEPATLVGWWWAAFVLQMLMGRITSHMGSDNNTAGISQEDLLPFLLDAGTHLLAATLTWRAIGRCAGFEAQLAMRQKIDQLGQPTPPSPADWLDQSDYALAEGY